MLRRNGGSLWFAVIPAVVIVAFMILPSSLPATAQGSSLFTAAGGSPSCDQGTTNGSINVCLTLHSTSIPVSPILWGTTISPRARLIPGEGTLLNATPTEIIVWPGAQSGEDYNPLNNTIYTVTGPKGSKVGNWVAPGTDEAEFVSWCKSINCQAIFQVPGEINNSGIASEIVNCTVDAAGTIPLNLSTGQPYCYGNYALGFTPSYWEIGNEPELWRLYDRPWPTWHPEDESFRLANGVVADEPAAYAQLVNRYINAILGYHPSTRFIGIPATGRPNGDGPLEDWVANVTAIDGAYISGVAYHSYPARNPPVSLSTFYAAINGSAGLTGRVPEAREGIAWGSNTTKNPDTTCTGRCPEDQGVFITEFGTGLSHTQFGPWEEGFPGALDFAAQVTQAMDLNVTNLDVFSTVFNTNNSWFNLSGAVRPSYTLFSEVLNHLGNVAYPVNLTTSPTFDGANTSLGGSLYGIATIDTKNDGRADLMLVNLDLNTSVSLSPKLPGISPTEPVEVWEWRGNLSEPHWGDDGLGSNVTTLTSQPVPTYYPHGLPSSFTLPYQTVLLFEAYPNGGVQVNFTATGFTAADTHPRWYVNVGGSLTTSNGSDNLTFFLPAGTFPVTAPAIPLENGSAVTADLTELAARERYEPFPASTITISSGELGGATVDFPLPYAHQWSTNISVNPSGGGYVVPSPQWWNASVPLNLVAQPAFHHAFSFWEGYGNGSANSSSPEVRASPTSWIRENATFTWGYAVTFNETGLPAGTSWSVAVRSHVDFNGTILESNNSESSIANSLEFQEPNGTFGFNIGSVAGYRASLPASNLTGFLTNSSFTVAGGPSAVWIQFTPTTPPAPRYAVDFEESGLPTGSRWWLSTRNVTTTEVGNQTTVNVTQLTESSTSSTMTFYESSGAYGYNSSTIPGFRAHPPAFGYNVTGPGLVVWIEFSPVLYNVIWEESGLGLGLSWSVLVTNSTATTEVESVGAWTTARLVNGTYSYSIPDVADFVPLLDAGIFTVDGFDIVFTVPFPQASFSVTFAVANLPANDPWEVRLSNATATLTGPRTVFSEPNGTYTFDVIPPSGYLAEPSHGTVTVDDRAIAINVSFAAAGLPPVPPVLSLGMPAALAAGAIGLVAVGILLVGRSRRRRQSAGEP
jgi:hypothetical protein